MMKDISIDYLGGSGFLVALGDVGMLFDASEHGQDRRIMPERETLAAFRKLYVFVSHRHDDHFSETIYDLCGENAVYIVGFDIPQPHRGVRMNPGEEQGFGPVNVRAFGSTDEGVSFLVTMAGIRIFHAGDLNLWHWRDESTITEIEAAEEAFYACVAPIPKGEIDVAFFPVDLVGKLDVGDWKAAQSEACARLVEDRGKGGCRGCGKRTGFGVAAFQRREVEDDARHPGLGDDRVGIGY